ncbi:hypothetical protein PC112_g19609 [Phytophthora cactorum]|uniref:Uncharacterized protein n=1 Tax=Phytophthora cactorum TaxID=29920 RepID=A0A8T1BPP4_9STRA|nr:hypothetical protein PC112_g19609 [Phytophthora cactorum]KAG2904222.1 hypothetical protein PC117_g21092 [Phytophthora cactorum]
MLHFTPSHSCPPDNAKDCAAWKRETHGAVCEVASSPPSPTAQERFKKKLLALRGELAELERARKDQDRMLSELDVRIKALQNKHDYLRTASAEQDRKLLEQNKMLNELEEKSAKNQEQISMLTDRSRCAGDVFGRRNARGRGRTQRRHGRSPTRLRW